MNPYKDLQEAGYYEPEHTEVSSEIRDLHSGYYHPLDLINFKYEGQLMVVPAIFIKSISDENEWKEIMLNIRIGINVIALALGIASLGSASPFLLALAYTDIAYSVIDTGVALAEDELRKTEEGRAFLDAWTKVTLGVAAANAPLLLRTIFTNGPKLFLKATRATKDTIGKMLIKAFLEISIHNFDGNTLKIITNAQEIVISTKGIFNEITYAKLFEKGCLLLEGEVKIGGVSTKEYALTYNGIIITQGTAANKSFLKTLRSLKSVCNKEKELISLLEELYRLIPKRNGNVWQWINSLGKEIQTSYQTEKQILARIEQNLKDIETGKIKEIGDIFEVEVGEEWFIIAQKNNDKVIDYKNSVTGKNSKGKFSEPFGNIDFGTSRFIAEAKSNLTNNDAIIQLEKQLKKYIPEYAKEETKYFNGWSRKVVVVCDKLDETNIIVKNLKKKGVIFVKKNELSKLYN